PILRRTLDAGAEAARQPLAQLFLDSCRAEDAAAVLASVRKGDKALWTLLATVEARLRRPGPARKATARAIAEGADPIAATIELSARLNSENETEAALEVLEAAISKYPKAAILVGQRGQMQQSLGRFDAARADLRRAAQMDPADGEAYRAYAAGGKMSADDPMLAKMEAAATRSDLPPPRKWRLHFALAKALGDVGRTDEVFRHLHEANRLQASAFPFDFDAALTRARAQLAAFRTHLSGRAPEGETGGAIFVTGLPRSGTTLVETVLAAHSQVTAGGEMAFMAEALGLALEGLENGIVPDPAEFAEAGRRYLSAGRRRAGTDGLFTDKAIGTFTRIGFIAHALPSAPILVLKRDPRDVGLSAYRNMFPDGTHRFSTSLYEIGRYIRLHDALIAAWEELMPGRMHVVDYEALTAHPETRIPEIVAAAGLPWEDACLAPHKADRRVQTLSFAQVRQPIYRSSVAGWQQFEDELGPLLEGLETRIDLL
ncbi:tetratricopeptide repeat protein, partial [Rhodobacterales bacterium HKCCE3408]|nr:tetratricopeptide repeat protein [Rhodobacterales bacterium HKCCE3408]